MEKIHDVIALSKKNVAKCPWCKQKTAEQYVTFLKDEIAELEEAFQNNDLKNIEEELGDVLWSALTLAYLCERDKRIKPDVIISRVLEKFKLRKPWLLTDETVTLDNASRIWEAAKKKEKAKRVHKTDQK